MQKVILLNQPNSYPESILFLYRHCQAVYLFYKSLICLQNKDLSTKNTDVNYYYYLYI